MSDDYNQHAAVFEKKGIAQVKKELALGYYSSSSSQERFAEAWIGEKESQIFKWTKSGTIAAWVAAFLALLAIIVETR